MPNTIIGAVMQKILYPGKLLYLTDLQGNWELYAKIIQIKDVYLHAEILAAPVLPPDALTMKKLLHMSYIVPGDAVYTLDVEVIDCSDANRRLLLKQVQPVSRNDKRSHYRLSTNKLIYIAEYSGDGDISSEKWLQAVMLDISSGGASILSPVAAEPDNLLRVLAPLDEVDYVVETAARVVRQVKGDEGQVTLGVSFDGLSLPDHEKILDYILKIRK